MMKQTNGQHDMEDDNDMIKCSNFKPKEKVVGDMTVI